VPALGGAPGVHSAYYAGREGQRDERDARNNRKLLAELGDGRFAYYCCVMVLVRRPDDPRPLIAEGLWHGEIVRAPRARAASATTRFSASRAPARRPPSYRPR